MHFALRVICDFFCKKRKRKAIGRNNDWVAIWHNPRSGKAELKILKCKNKIIVMIRSKLKQVSLPNQLNSFRKLQKKKLNRTKAFTAKRDFKCFYIFPSSSFKFLIVFTWTHGLKMTFSGILEGLILLIMRFV